MKKTFDEQMRAAWPTMLWGGERGMSGPSQAGGVGSDVDGTAPSVGVVVEGQLSAAQGGAVGSCQGGPAIWVDGLGEAVCHRCWRHLRLVPGTPNMVRATLEAFEAAHAGCQEEDL